MSERIKPFYDVPADAEKTTLFEAAPAIISQGGKNYRGRVQIVQYWESMITNIEFLYDPEQSPELAFGDATITAAELRELIMLDITMRSFDGVNGAITEPIDLGTDHRLDRVTFHVPNLSDFTTRDSHVEFSKDGKRTVDQWCQVVLEHDGWQITIQSRPILDWRVRNMPRDRPVRFTALGDIRRSDGQQFKRGYVLPIIEILRVFLSFSEAEWIPPLFIVGSNSVNDRTWQRLTAFRPSSPWHTCGWLHHHQAADLATAFSGFCRLWAKENWRPPIVQAVTWLIEASKRHENLEGAVAFCQIPLEMLAWLIFADDTPIVDDGDFGRLGAANKIKLLLHHCGIPLDVPTQLQTLTKISVAGRQGKPSLSGPHVSVEIRNTIIHPNADNRKKFETWVKNHESTAQQLMQETVSLFTWYITLVLLRFMDYRGEYANNLIPQAPGVVEKVPWA